MSRLDGLRTLLLDSACRPVGTLTWRRAVVLDWEDRVDVLDYYDEVVRTSTDEFPLPAVARVRQYLKFLTWRMPFSRRAVLLRDDHTCQYCGKKPPLRGLTMDHVLPKSRGGPTSWENIVVACIPCNRRKGAKTPVEARMPLMRPPVQPRAMPGRRKTLTAKGEVPLEWLGWLHAV